MPSYRKRSVLDGGEGKTAEFHIYRSILFGPEEIKFPGTKQKSIVYALLFPWAISSLEY